MKGACLDDPSGWDKLWKRILDGDLDKVVDSFAVALQFNLCLSSAISQEEEEISHIGVLVPTCRIFPKQPAHVREELRQYARRVVGKHHQSKTPSHQGVVTMRIPAEMHASFSLPSPAPPKKKRRTIMTSSTSSQAQPLTLPPPPPPPPPPPELPRKGANVSCVECGMKKKHKSGCLFDLWKNDHNKPEVGASFPSRKRGVSQLEHLRMLFVEHREAIKVRYNMSSS